MENTRTRPCTGCSGRPPRGGAAGGHKAGGHCPSGTQSQGRAGRELALNLGAGARVSACVANTVGRQPVPGGRRGGAGRRTQSTWDPQKRAQNHTTQITM